jgi:two-component system NtrC family sensor kinase
VVLERRAANWKRAVGHPLRLFGTAVGTVLFVMAIIMALLAHRSFERIRLIERHRQHATRFGQVREGFQDLLLLDLQGLPQEPALYVLLHADVDSLIAHANELEPGKQAGLATLHDLLASSPILDHPDLLIGFGIAQDLVVAERRVEGALLQRARRDAGREWMLALGVLVILPLLGVVSGLMVRRRILRPLDDLRELFIRLANGEFRAVDAEHADPVVAPLFQNFNHLVTRLAELEQQHQEHARTLEREVKTATHTLLEQHRSLADAERLAAVGEMAAGLAHELRNPLAGIAMTLGNLRRDLEHPDFIARIDPVLHELERMTRLLSDYLSAGRHEPEPARPTNLRALVADLLALVRYQTPAAVSLECEVPNDITCHLPRDRVRQALLNLILNAVQVLGPEGGAVTVSAGMEDGSVRLAVTDDGPGFPEDLLHNGIRSFRAGRPGGMGLGLAIVRRVAQDLGGTVHFANREPRGGSVSITFPCVQP